MSGRRYLLMAAALLGAPPAGLSAGVPTHVNEPPPAAGGTTAGDVEDAIRSLREMMFPAGERVENWNVGGADLAAEVRAMGADKYYLLETDASDGTSLVAVLTDLPIAQFAPAAWRAVEAYGSAETPLENPSVTFGFLTPRYVLAGRGSGKRLKDADCADKVGHAVLFEVPGAPESPEDKDMPDFFKGVMLAIDGQIVCARYDGDRAKGYAARYFHPDGRLLLNPDRSVSAGHVTIVPAAPIDTLIKPPPPAPATPPK